MNWYENVLTSVRSLAKGEQTPIDITDLLYQHKCFYLLSQADKTHKYQAEMAMNRVCISERYRVCRSIFEAFEATGISYAVIKGAVLSKSAYGDINLRKSSDVDLLINRKDIDAAKKILLDNEFIQGRVTNNGIKPFSRRELVFQSVLSHQVAPFVKKTSNPLCPYINVDINMDIFWGESERKTDVDYLLSHTEDANICGCEIKKLATETEFVALCLHHYKDMNSIYLLSQGSLKLFLFCDIYFYLKNKVPNRHQLKALCEKLGASEYIYYCVFYTNEIFQDDFLIQYIDTFETESSRKLLDTFGLANNEIKSWNISFPERLFMRFPNDAFCSLLTEKDRTKIKIHLDQMQ